jgi:hypothetical protein
MAKVMGQYRPGIVIPKAQDPINGQASEREETSNSSFNEDSSAIQPAYQAYLEGRKALAQAFRSRERHDQEAYREAERRYRLCEEAIDKAMTLREKAEQDASETYRDDVDKAVDKASQGYKDETKRALIECKQRVMDAWRSSMETPSQMTDVCEEAVEKTMKDREKAELRALESYREEVDRAVEKASHAYKSRIKQALVDCRLRVMDAWEISTETSAKMTGVFEGRYTRSQEQPPERRPDHQQPGVGAAVQRASRSFASAVQRSMRALEL